MAYSTMNTVPAADVESETPLLQRDVKINAKTLVGGAAAAAFVLGILAATAATSSKPAGMSTALSSYDQSHIYLQATQYRGGGGWMCLDIPDINNPDRTEREQIVFNTNNKIPLQIWECGDWNKGWNLRKTRWGSEILEWKDSGFCVGGWPGNGLNQGDQLFMWNCDSTADDQLWHWDHEGEMGYANGMDTIYLPESSNPVLCMDVAGGPNEWLPSDNLYENGNPVQAWECNEDSAANQKWSFSD